MEKRCFVPVYSGYANFRLQSLGNKEYTQKVQENTDWITSFVACVKQLLCWWEVPKSIRLSYRRVFEFTLPIR